MQVAESVVVKGMLHAKLPLADGVEAIRGVQSVPFVVRSIFNAPTAPLFVQVIACWVPVAHCSPPLGEVRVIDAAMIAKT